MLHVTDKRRAVKTSEREQHLKQTVVERRRDALREFNQLVDWCKDPGKPPPLVLWPYGLWTCKDGREILFDRGYTPIWQYHGGRVEAADRYEYVEGIVRRETFHYHYTDVCRYQERLCSIFKWWRSIRPPRPGKSHWQEFKRKQREDAE
jgi:hypothetical protein